MGKPCRLSFFAYRDKDPSLTYGEVGVGHFTKHDPLNGISYCEWLLELGHTREWLDDFDLWGYIDWAKRTMELGKSAI